MEFIISEDSQFKMESCDADFTGADGNSGRKLPQATPFVWIDFLRRSKVSNPRILVFPMLEYLRETSVSNSGSNAHFQWGHPFSNHKQLIIFIHFPSIFKAHPLLPGAAATR